MAAASGDAAAAAAARAAAEKRTNYSWTLDCRFRRPAPHFGHRQIPEIASAAPSDRSRKFARAAPSCGRQRRPAETGWRAEKERRRRERQRDAPTASFCSRGPRKRAGSAADRISADTSMRNGPVATSLAPRRRDCSFAFFVFFSFFGRKDRLPLPSPAEVAQSFGSWTTIELLWSKLYFGKRPKRIRFGGFQERERGPSCLKCRVRGSGEARWCRVLFPRKGTC